MISKEYLDEFFKSDYVQGILTNPEMDDSEYWKEKEDKAVKFNPTEDRVLVEEVDQDNISAGGIHLGTSVSTVVKHGVVVAVGPGRVNDALTAELYVKPAPDFTVVPIRHEMTVKVGDKVVFPFKSIPVKVNGKEYYLIGEVEVLGLLSD